MGSENLLLPLSAILTSALSAITGMAGGTALLTIMSIFFTLDIVVPIHGIAQLSSNSSRVFLLRKFVNKRILSYFLLGLPFGVIISALFLRNNVSEDNLKIFLVCLILYAVFKPKKLPELKIPDKYFPIIGLMTGALGILIGSVGPFLAPFFVRSDLGKEEIIATKSSMQLFTHLAKIPTFIMLGFSYIDYSLTIFLLIIAVVIGTSIGIRVLKVIPKNIFFYLFKIVLLLAALRLIISVYQK